MESVREVTWGGHNGECDVRDRSDCDVRERSDCGLFGGCWSLLLQRLL